MNNFLCKVQEGAKLARDSGAGRAVLHPVYYRRVCEKAASKSVRFAVQM